MIVEKAKPIERAPAPKNVIIEYERPNVCVEKQVTDEGVVRADPRTYNPYNSCGREEVRVVDRITDLPVTNVHQSGYRLMSASHGGNLNQVYQQARPATSRINASGSSVLAKGPATYTGPWNTTYKASYSKH